MSDIAKGPYQLYPSGYSGTGSPGNFKVTSVPAPIRDFLPHFGANRECEKCIRQVIQFKQG
jgi:hypothetical protein